ncbi:PDDEXK family nuclease [Flavobacterium fluviale]|uniref:DUF91 domain-containing protein n=1 Tax=Flavobacterium fluviale TaxID=2249356 RepID=A0A344LMS9_9FLAO|nr:hypothetical protein [Flavobacterium fluviale]AXB55221.1 hypothetical protein HYN86_00800 [Flavobacterium fluviale]
MAIFNISKEGIYEVSETSFHANGILERTHLQNYLRDKIEILCPKTLIISEEFSDWDESKKRIDLLGIDKDANLVVIELKRTDTGDHMELQALRYASMISTLNFEKCVSIFQNYIDKRGFQTNAKDELMNFLEWEIPLENDFASNVKIILASRDFSKELTTSVMWLISKGIDITCIKLIPYNFKDDLLLDINQIIPLPEAESYLIKIKEKTIERQIAIQNSRDNTKYLFNNMKLGKGRLVLEIVKSYLNKNPNSTFGQLQNRFPPNLQGSTGVINTLDHIKTKYEKASKKRHFIEDEYVLVSGDNISFAVSTEWGIGNIHNLIEIAKEEDFQIEEV